MIVEFTSNRFNTFNSTKFQNDMLVRFLHLKHIKENKVDSNNKIDSQSIDAITQHSYENEFVQIIYIYVPNANFQVVQS